MLRYNISKSTLYSIIKNKKLQFNDKNTKNIYQDLFGINKIEIDTISEFIKPPKPPLTLKMIQQNLKHEANSWLSLIAIKKYIKNELNYS